MRRQQHKSTFRITTTYVKNTVLNFSLYQLFNDELTALSYGLDHRIPSKVNHNRIYTEFQQFYQSLLKDISHVPDEDLSRLKTKLRNTCDKYSQIYIPYKCKKIIEQLSNNRNICIMRQDKGRRVVIIDKSKYTAKCLELLQTNKFSKLKHDPTKSFENKIQRTLRKLNKRLSTQQYYQLYPTGSFPGKFYGTAKLHKLPINATIHDLQIPPIVSNIVTASYHLAKYLAKVLSPFAYSEYTIWSTIDLMKKVKNKRIPQGFSMVSFDVKSLFTSVPLEKTIDIALERIYLRKEIVTILTKNEMKNLLILCTKNVLAYKMME